MKILLVGDDEVTNREMKTILEVGADEVHMAQSAAVALDKLQTQDFGVVICDWNGSPGAGLDLCRSIRSFPAGGAASIILVTSRGSKQDMKQALAAGADDFIAKPFEPAELQARVANAGRMLTRQANANQEDRQFHVMFQEHSAVMLLIDPNTGRILDANGAACQFYGFPIATLKAMSIDQINCMEPDLLAIERTRALQKHNNYFHFQHKLASGEIREVEIYSTPIISDGQEVLFSIVHDITERKLAETALNFEKESLAKLIHVSEEFLADPDAEIDFQKITDNLVQLAGCKLAVFNLFDENGKDFTTIAISGLSLPFTKMTSILGFNLSGKKWAHDPLREAKTRDKVITRFPSILELAGDVIPKPVLVVVKKLFNPGETVVAKISTKEKVLGDFTLIMPAGQRFTAENVVSIYIRQVGLLLQRKNTQSALRTSQQAYRQLVERVPEVIYTDEIEGGWQYLAPNIQTLSGYTAQELIADPDLWMNNIVEVDRMLLQTKIRSLALGEVYNFEYRFQTRDRGLIWVRDHGVVLENGSEGFEHTRSTRPGRMIQGLLSDITPQKMIELARQQSEERFRSLFDHSPIALHEEDFSTVKQRLTQLRAEGVQDFEAHLRQHPETVKEYAGLVQVVNVNQASLELYGAASKADMLTNLSSFFSDQENASFRAELVQIAMGMTHFELEMTNRTLDGRSIRVKLNWRAFPGHENDLSRIIVSLIDITEQKKSEVLLLQQSRLQQLLMEISSTFINLQLDDVEETIRASLQKLASFVQADRAYIFDYDFDKGTCSNSVEWCADGIEPQIEALQDVPLQAIPDWVTAHRSGEIMLVPDVSALAPGYLRELLESQHIKSLVAVPTLGLESCKGFVGFDWVNSHHSGSEGEEHLLTIFAQNLVNIQQRKQANDALRESQSLYYSLVEVSPLSICRKDLDGRFTFANKKFLETSQLTLADLLGKSDYDLHPSELAEKYRRDDLEVIKSGQVKELIEGRAVVGEPISANVVQTVKVPVYGGDGKINGIQISFWDITERIRAEELLKESEKRFHSLFDNSPISLWEEDFSAVRQRLGELSASSSADFSAFLEEHPEIATECIGLIKVLDVNKATLNLFKAAGMQQIVEHLWDIYQANDRQNFNSELALIASGITHFEIETSKQRLDGKTLAISLNWAAVPGYEGDLSKVIVSMIDITERKQAEKELLETNRQLEETIFRANIFAAQAEMANIAKSAFLANMSHEIRTPMNGVIGMTGLLMDTNLDEEQRRYAEIVRTSGEALLTLINDILDFSKIEAGKMELETLDFDLESMLDDFAVSLALRAQEKGLEFLCAADPDVPTLLQGDPGRLRQILTNLVGNAIKFTARGEVAVRVSVEKTQPVMANYAEKSDTAFAALRFSIRDTGIGIPPEKLGLLFNKFSQVDASTTRQYGGTGLGLAISKQLVEMMNGRVGVKSEPGRGSEFWFTVRLPLQTASRASEIPAQANLAGVRILVVDDNAASRTILKTRLTSWGLLPSEAQDGDSALLALNGAREAGDPFQVAILDMQMPGMNGAMLGEAIKNDECLANTHLILLSSLGERGDARRFAKIGFVGYLTKPLRHVDLFNVLSLTLTGGDAPAGSSAIVTRHSAREIRRVTASSSARILLAEDNITNQQVALGILTKLGYKADAVANGLEAITALENIPYDVVLMDVQMPELDGVDATRIIRNDKSLVLNHAIPIIAMTAHALQIDRERCLKAGMNDYITKPVNPQALAQALERWLPAGLPMAETPASTPRVPGFESNGLVFDKAALMHRLMDDDELANLIISGFLEDMPVQINRLKAGLEDGDVTLVERQAHSIKGAASNMGGDALRDIAAELEKSAKTSDLSGVQALMGELDLQFARLRAELENEI